ncbi:CotH kinase family protein [Runella zeae]|uniref:CotH kinase family protein n=3 Tax=Runella zeae TaxID=94255 RepID=UPI002354508C|nr:CotH kinase family protein [Runella zeae]
MAITKIFIIAGIGMLGGVATYGHLTSQVKTTSPSKPNYQVVFPQDRVNTLEITLSKSAWDTINVDMKAKFKQEFGKMSNPSRLPFDKEQSPRPPREGGRPPMFFGNAEPQYVEASLKFRGKVWRSVGFRLKGNSTLMRTWGEGIYKLPFRVDFDEFKKRIPQNQNPDFYGFKELSFSPAVGDNSLIREKITSDIFRQAGVPAAQTAFYKIYINFGEGLKYCGIYTLVEVIDDTMIQSQFGESSGNIYKPESTLSRFNRGQFEKKNHKKEANYSDVEGFVNILNDDSLRISNAPEWRTKLEKTFDVVHFLKYLAVNNSIVNWDSYGAMPHNYYLYHSPTKGLVWIPWDHNEAMLIRGGKGSPMARTGPLGGSPPEGFGFPPSAPPMMGNVSLNIKEVGKQWPLIRYLADDPVYFDQYISYVDAFRKGVFSPENMEKLFAKNHALIAPYITGELKEKRPYSHLKNTEDFENSTAQLNEHVVERQKAMSVFLEKVQK